MSTQSCGIWLELVKGVPTAVVALVIGLLAALIAWNSYRVARAKFRLDLFDKRYEVFDHLWVFLSTHQDGASVDSPSFANMSNAIPKAHFLFGGEIGRLFQHFQDLQQDLDHNLRLLKTENNEEKRKPLQDAIVKQHKEKEDALNSLRDTFRPYLGFKKWH